MEIFNADIDIDILEFCDRLGRIRSTCGCSFKGKVEFDSRIKLLQELLQKEEDDKTIMAIYKDNREFAHHCDRCLELNGIEFEWLTEQHFVKLLFMDKGMPGLLVRLNAVNNTSAGETDTSKSGKLYHQFLGALYKFTKDPEQAFRLAEDKPFKEVAGMIKESADSTDEPKPKERSPEGKREISDRSRIDLMAMREKIKSGN